MKKGDEYVSNFSKDRRLIIRDINKKTVTIEVDRRVIDKSTGEIKLDRRTREVAVKDLPIVLQSYTLTK